jgi:hypothetical protein
MPKVNKPEDQPIGLLVTIRTETTGHEQEHETRTKVAKTPIVSISNATIELVDKLFKQSFNPRVQNEIVDKWLSCFASGHALQTIHKDESQSWRTVQFEAYIELMTSEEYKTWEEGVKASNSRKRSGRGIPSCSACGTKHDTYAECPDEEPDDEDDED